MQPLSMAMLRSPGCSSKYVKIKLTIRIPLDARPFLCGNARTQRNRTAVTIQRGIYKYRYNATPLIAASRNGHGGTVKLLLEAENHIFDCRDDLGPTALCWARKNGDIQTIKLLLRHTGGMEPEASGEDASSGDSAKHINVAKFVKEAIF
ncbi:LOW QUALITY PROTEIN: PFS domain-containing protein [Colletotrichum tofieldiae]|nr:LOW QUALITY PROTEIN: PFS domain-containing protein [Colletotrichum tofieldiae]